MAIRQGSTGNYKKICTFRYWVSLTVIDFFFISRCQPCNWTDWKAAKQWVDNFFCFAFCTFAVPSDTEFGPLFGLNAHCLKFNSVSVVNVCVAGGDVPPKKLQALQKVLQSEFCNAIREVNPQVRVFCLN